MKDDKKGEVLELCAKASELISQGKSRYAVAKILGVRPHKIYYSIKKYGKN